MSDKALTVRQDDQYFSPTRWNQMKVMAETLIKSQALPRHITNAAQLMVIMQTGFELGLKPMQSVNGLYIVNGRVAMQSQLMATKLHQAGVKMKWIKDSETEAAVELSGLERTPYTGTFTLEEAKAAGLIKPGGPWEKYPKAMLRARALSIGARVFCPDLLEGAYTMEEVAEVEIDEEGNEKPVAPKENTPRKPQEPEDPNIDIKRMIVAESKRLKLEVPGDGKKTVENIEQAAGLALNPENLVQILDTLKGLPTPPPDTPEKPQDPPQTPPETPTGPKAAEGEYKEPEQPAAGPEKPAEPKPPKPDEPKASKQYIELFKSQLNRTQGVPLDDLESQKGYLSLLHNIEVAALDDLTQSQMKRAVETLLKEKKEKPAAQ